MRALVEEPLIEKIRMVFRSENNFSLLLLPIDSSFSKCDCSFMPRTMMRVEYHRMARMGHSLLGWFGVILLAKGSTSVAHIRLPLLILREGGRIVLSQWCGASHGTRKRSWLENHPSTQTTWMNSCTVPVGIIQPTRMLLTADTMEGDVGWRNYHRAAPRRPPCELGWLSVLFVPV